MRRLIALFKNIDSDASDRRRDDRFQCRQVSETSPFVVDSLETRMLLSADIGLGAALVDQFDPTPEPPIVLDWSDSGGTDEGDAHDGAPGEMEEEEEEEGGDFIDHESFDALYGEFEFDEFLELEKDGPLGGQGGSVEELPEPADALVNNNAGASGTVGFTQSETSVIAFGNTVLVAFNDSGSTTGGTNKFTGFSRSTDGGVTFTDGGVLPTNAGGDAGDPVLARNNTSGRIYFSTLGSSSVSTIQVFRSDDGGATWMDPVNGTPGGNSEDKEWVTVDNFAGSGNGNVYLVSRRFGPTAPGIYFFRSTDNGDTFGPTGGTLIVPVSQGAFVAVGPDHSVYVFWWTGTSIQMRKSTDQGLTFGASVTVASGLVPDLGLTGTRQGTATASIHRSNEFPHAVINPVNGNIYVAYNNDGPGADRADVFVVQSTTGGATWGAPVKVNDDLTTTDQWQPTLAVTPTGDKLGIFYYSRQEDPTGNNLFKYYGRIASISGSTLTFGPSFPISDTPSLPEFGRDGVVNPTYMGDYDTAYATIGFFHVSWSDSRSELSGGAGRNDPNVYYEAVDLGLTVLTTVPADDSVVSSIPLNYVVTFSDAIQVATVQATDLMVDGITASSFVVNTPTQVTFTFSSAPFSSQGLHVITMAAGAILRDSDGDTLAAYAGNFRYDATPLQVTTTVPSVNGVFILPSPFTYDVNFNEAIDPASVQTWDLVVSGIAGAVVSSVTVLPGNTTARFTLSGITAQGSLTATITAGSISDAFGNPGSAFSGTYLVDVVIASYPTPLIAKDPLGSLIYDPTVSGIISFAGDVDSFTLNVDANQTISVIVTPSLLLQPRIEIFDPNNVSQAVATAPASTIVTGIQASHANVGGVYTFAVTGANGSAGGYTLQVILNAAFEPEGKILGATDDTLASTRQTINSSDAGSIRADGAHTAVPNFYFVGQSTLENRNYATFSIPATTPTILGAELRLANPGPGYISPDPSETYTLFDVSATPAALDTPRSAGDATGILLFGDLGFGAVYGSRVVSAADNNKTVAITLNSAAVAALNAAIGSTISLGGAITTLAGSAAQIMFGGASGVPSDVQLVLQTVNIVDTSFITLSTPQASALRGAVLGQTDLANYTAAAVPFVFEDISTTGTLITTLTNQDNTAVTGPIGFTFPFFGVNNTLVSITSNGLLTFGGINFSPINADLSTQPTQASIAPFWDDLHTGGGVTGSNVFIQNLGSGANQHVTIQWNKIRFASGGTTGDTITFEAQLYADGRIQFNYQDLASGTAAGNEGASATVGVKPASGTQNLTRLLLAFNNGPNTFVGTGKSTLITPLPPTPDYYAFTLNAGDTTTLAVGSAASVTLELRDANDVILASGSGAGNLASVISNFAVPTGGTYYARITGISGAISAPYSFVITRNAAFDTEDNSRAATAQPFGTQGALGAIPSPQILLNAVDSGWFQADGTHTATNNNYTVGLGLLPPPATSTEFRNYSTFTLPAGTAKIIGAELRLFNPGPPAIPFPGYISPDPTETYTLFDVSADPAQLDANRVSGDATGIAIHGDLASGTIYGTRLVSAADNNTMVGISLNADAVAALNAAIGAAISFGGAITTLEGTAQQTVFAFTSGAPGTVQLVLQTVTDDWYSITLPGTVNALRLETSTPGDGPGEPVNTLNPKIELYNSDGTALIASGVAGSDGRNESIVALGLTPGATYKVRVTNDNGTSGEYFLTKNFEFSPVVTSLNVASPINENDTATLNGTFTDLDALDTHTVMIHWGTGGSTTLTLAAGVLSFSATHQYLDDNPTGTLADISTIAVTVTDNQFGSGSASVDVMVHNVAPDVAAVSGPSSGVRGQTLTFSGAFTDVGSLDTHEVRWDFGDGNVIDFHPTTDANALTASHVYAVSGVYTLTLSIRDDDGGLTSVNAAVTVTAVAIQTDPCDPGKTALVVGGTTDNDTIVLNPQNNGGDIVVLINGVSQGTFRPTGHIVVYGQDGDDDIQIASSIALDAWLYGDAGNDRLKGGAGSSILLGGDGDDQLNGGSGRSILIGGRGNDRLVGGSGDDILIAGFILNDRNALFLCVLQDTWKSTDGYAVRITRLRLLLIGLVVIDDNCIDMLTGASGLDWYFLGLTDVITGNQNGESVG